MPDLERLLRPRSIAVVGGGAWCEAVLRAVEKFGFDGTLYSVHPSKPEIAGIRAYPSVNHLPEIPDATFVGINRDASIGAIERLRKLDAGGAVCFASGYAEAEAEDDLARDAQVRLLRAAGEMPVLGPNCYGFINALDGVAIWPDQHGCKRVERGVAILTQSSNISINLTMQKRGVPLAMMVTCGNQAQINQAEIATALLDDDRITAIGFHIEGFQDVPAWEAMARKARDKGVPLVALKSGRSEQAQIAAISHTASLAGGDAGASALLSRLGIGRVFTPGGLLEALKLLHGVGVLASNQVASISCSGGEASLMADLALDTPLEYPELNEGQSTALRNALGPKVALANPLDYHTYIWRDVDAMARAWSAISDPNIAITLVVVDFPRADMCDDSDWICAKEAAIRTHRDTGRPVALISSLPELLPEEVSAELAAEGVLAMNGLSEGFEALVACLPRAEGVEDLLPALPLSGESVLIDEATAKATLAEFGLNVPSHVKFEDHSQISAGCESLTFPVAVKALGSAHKSDNGGVALNCETPEAAQRAASAMQGIEAGFLVEEMATSGVEILVGVIRDPAHGFVLTLGLGGVLTEVVEDTQSLLLPVDRKAVKQALLRLKASKLLLGYRGSDPVDLEAIIDAVLAVQSYVISRSGNVEEVEINPLICTPSGAVAVDALLREVP